jgi:hypothetical protein
MNMGPKTEKWLSDIGIHTDDDLREFGLIEAYCELKARDPQKVNLMMLWAMQGALMGVNCLHLPDEIKTKLKKELDQFSAPAP